MTLPLSGLKNKTQEARVKEVPVEQETAVKQMFIYSGFLLGVFFYIEDEGDIFLRNFGLLSTTTRHYIPEDTTLQRDFKTTVAAPVLR
jgi:hypothetical protein